jgi:Asp-tRNA(Asn)/Glu-tRNA(Gln) amidotransferase C subunit
LDVADEKATLDGHGVNNIFRADVPVAGLETEAAMQNAPERIEDEIRMPRIVE